MHKIKIGGSQYPVAPTMGAMLEFRQITGKEVSDMSGDMDMIMTYLFCLVKSACRREKVEFPHETVMDFADNIDMEDFVKWQSDSEDLAPKSEAKETAKKKK